MSNENLVEINGKQEESRNDLKPASSSVKSSSIREKVKDVISIIQSVIAVCAIFIAAYLYFEQRESVAKLNISHTITHKQIADRWIWIHASITISNIGKRILSLESGTVYIQKIIPLDKSIEDLINNNQHPISKEYKIVSWPLLDEPYKSKINVAIEPGEIDKLEYEFIIPSYIETIKIYSYFENKESHPIGWSQTTIYDLKRKEKFNE